jgi:hypothetical protein
MEEIAGTIRKGLPWVVLPLGVVSLLRLGLEPRYLTVPFCCWLALIPSYAVIQTLLLRHASPSRIRLSILFNFLGINIGYTAIGAALRSSAGWRADAFVFGIDRWIFGRDPQQLLQPLQAPWLSTVAMLGYLGFAGFLVYLFLAEAFELSQATGMLQLGLMRLYGLGFSGYLLLPAAGPAFHHPGLLPPIAHSTLSARLDPWVLGNCSHVDVCPSIHAAVCAFLLVWTYPRHRLLFFVLALPCAALLLGTVYFQYHYFTDVPFGLLLGAGSAASVSHVPYPKVRRSAGPPG